MKRPVVLVFNRYYLPGYRAGGPIRTLANLVERLGGEFDFRLVALDRDSRSEHSYPGIVHGEWNRVGRAQVRYLAPGDVTLARIGRLIDEVRPDVIYLNSFFDVGFTQKVLWARRARSRRHVPVVLAPRGEFSQGALALKRMRKAIFKLTSALVGLYRPVFWQASSERERDDILRGYPGLHSDRILVAPNLSPEPVAVAPPRVRGGSELRVCFLGRIAPMKNLAFALDVLSRVRMPVHFDVYGPTSDAAYLEECRAVVARLPSHVAVAWHGPLAPESVHQTLAPHDLFLFPTRGENYGHVIHEALTAGLPVLISDQTPWAAVVARGIGWTLPLDRPEAFVDVIHRVAAWSPEERERVSQECVRFASERAEGPEILEQNRSLFRMALTGPPVSA